jgi:hypothetical protein
MCRKIEKYNHKVDILLNCLTKLDKVRVNISLLQVRFYSLHCFIMPGSAFSCIRIRIWSLKDRVNF